MILSVCDYPASHAHMISVLTASPLISPFSYCCEYYEPNAQSTQRVLTKVPEATQAEMTRAVDAAEQAFLGGWRDSSVLSRQRIMMK